MTRKYRRSRRSTRRGLSKDTMRWIVVLFLVISVAILYLVSRNSASGSAPLPLEISVEEAYQKYQQGVFFLDVRRLDEWETYHIPNTTLIPLEELPSRVSELPRDRQIVVVCRTGNRGAQARDYLLSVGFSTVTSMAGGVERWSALNYPIEGTRP
ncbi:MAG: rhodanese-like domain-containing protein [Anaerolineales bacterium]